MSLWDWTLSAYARPGAQEACLDLQDKAGQSVCLLLWAAWAGVADPDLIARAAEVARPWERDVLTPLRRLRRALKTPKTAFDGTGCEALRQEVKAAELQAEQLLLDALEDLTGPRRDGVSPAEALAAVCAVWGGAVPEADLARLADALDLGLIGGGDGPHDGSGERGLDRGMDEDSAEWEQGLRARLALLVQEHADMDAAIQALSLSPLPDIQVVGRLKRRKLALKDEIARIHEQLTPDIIA